MRDPVARAISAGKMKAGEEYSQLSDSLVRKYAMVPFQLKMSRYSAILERFETHFPGQVFAGFMDDIIARPHWFLGVEHDRECFSRADLVANKGKSYRAGADLHAELYAILSNEYDRLAMWYPEQVATWKGRYKTYD